jgi:hypothetical protein
MKKNLYYRASWRRENVLKQFILAVFMMFASYPRLVIEVFLRKNMGERYFRLISAITVAVILLGIRSLVLYTRAVTVDEDEPLASTGNHFLTWYIFVGLFLLVSLMRYAETRRQPSVFDFARFSLSRGEPWPFFSSLKIGDKKVDIRLIETVLEPLPFLILGIVLWLFHQPVGMLLIVCAIFYCVSYLAAYNQGDNFVMDKIDEIIANEELKKAFVDGLDEDQTRGFRFMGRRPKDENMRRQILPLMTDENDDTVEVQ